MAANFVDRCLAALQQYKKTEHTPLDLGVRQKAVIITCMDSRLCPEKMFGLQIGDAEVIRNGGGRVTDDVIRSLLVCHDLLKCDTVMLVHHTNCGAQNAIRDLGITAEHVRAKVGQLLGTDMGGMDMKPIVSQDRSILDDVKAIRSSPLVGKKAKLIVGYVYDTHTAQLTEVTRDEIREL